MEIIGVILMGLLGFIAMMLKGKKHEPIEETKIKEVIKDNNKTITTEQQKIDSLKTPEATDLNPKEVEDFWNKKK